MNLESLGYSQEEQIFYGVITVYLYPCTGENNIFDIDNIIREELNEENIKKALQTLNDLSYINIKYKDYYLPCIPETNIKIKEKSDKEKNLDNKIKTLFSNPLIKFDLNMKRETKEFENVNKFIGIMSGKRSSIIKGKDGKFYRLKGCGNYKKGFTILENYNDINFTKKEIRGCQFENNVFRELFYSYKIHKLLKKNNMFCANIPIGYFKYNNDIKFKDESLNDKNIIINEVPEIDKYCSIYETLGDRRLGTHLLKGIEIIIEAIIETAINEFHINEESYNNIYMLFNEKRRKISINSEYAIREVYLPEGLTLKQWCNNPVYKNKFYDNLISYKSLINYFDSNFDLNKIKKSSNLIEKWSTILENKVTFKKDHFKKIIDDLLKLQNLLSNKSLLEYLLDLFIRIGYETAKIKRILQDADFNWGTYNGQAPSDIFCSAHYNNFIVLSGNYSYLLAPIDFDLAFEREFFVNNDKESKNFGKNDNSTFDNFLNREINTLLFNIINGKESEYYLNQNIEQKFKDIIYFLLNDSLIESYMKTFDKIELDNLEKYNQNGILEYLVKLSLILTYDRIS